MKTSELTGAALDWAVAQCEGLIRDTQGGWVRPVSEGLSSWRYGLWTPSNNWAQAGPIIEREGVDLNYSCCEGTSGEMWDAACEVGKVFGGPTPLIAAMRCYVASKLGDEVEINELVTNNGESK